MVNRRITMDSILKVAAEQQHRQFILLTPQNMRYGFYNFIIISLFEDADGKGTCDGVI